MPVNNKIRYVAFLRGINVGGRALMRMTALRNAFEEMGFKNVRTLLASGNVIFESGQADKKAMAGEIGSGLKKLLPKGVGVVVRSLHDLEKLRTADPFKGVAVTPATRLYVTFRNEKSGPRNITIPYSAPQTGFFILRATPTEVFSVLDLSRGKGTSEAMSIIEKEFGANVTTRNWHTVLKILQ